MLEGKIDEVAVNLSLLRAEDCTLAGRVGETEKEGRKRRLPIAITFGWVSFYRSQAMFQAQQKCNEGLDYSVANREKLYIILGRYA
ncbi:hypothetical protein NDU88_001542 [Pleurodeles waltl]|uniref:Uncharacterized protein n=1 Tax=Pleurodeles waltl TaxID=8319 RepID=A0AAV7MKT3_PLEWA|nr:hypothetical protein NDU88_001542 [Pleurodeles waltl]